MFESLHGQDFAQLCDLHLLPKAALLFALEATFNVITSIQTVKCCMGDAFAADSRRNQSATAIKRIHSYPGEDQKK